MARLAFELIHAPILSSETWAGTASALADAFAVTLPELPANPGSTTFWDRHVRAIVAGALDYDVVLVAHSGAGPLLPAAVEVLGERVRGCVFVDAALPCPGRSRFEAFENPGLVEAWRQAAKDGVLPRWDELRLKPLVRAAGTRRIIAAQNPALPVAVYEEPLPDVELPAGLPVAFVRFSPAYDREFASASAAGWMTADFPGTHLEMVNRPEQFSSVLAGLADEMQRR